MVLGPDHRAQLITELEKLRKMTEEEISEYTAHKLIEESETLGKGKGTKRSNEKKLEIVEDKAKKFFAEKKYHQAMLCYQACVHIDPRNWKYASNISEINLHLRKWFIAEDAASKSLALDKGNIKSLFRRAKARKMRGNLDGAAKDLAAVRAALPEDESALAEEKSLSELQKMSPAQLNIWMASTPPPPPNLGDEETMALLSELRALVT